MAVATDQQKLRSTLKQTAIATGAINAAATDSGWVPMRDFMSILIAAVVTTAGGAITVFKILGNTEEDGSGTDVEVKVHALGDAPDAIGDQVFLEASAEEIKAAATAAGLASIKGVSASLQSNNAGVRCAVIYTRSAKHCKKDLTVDVVA